jgi:hypothetical protein
MRPKSKTKSKQPNKVLEVVKNYGGQIILVILLGAATYTFFTRLDKLETLTANLNNTVIQINDTVKELDKNYSNDSENKGQQAADINQLKIDVGILKGLIKP